MDECDGGATAGCPPQPVSYTGAGGAAEWATRVTLANAYQTVAKLGKADWGWTHCVYNHITVKLPPASAVELDTPGPLFLINAFGCRFDEVTPESLHTGQFITQHRVISRLISTGTAGGRESTHPTSLAH